MSGSILYFPLTFCLQTYAPYIRVRYIADQIQAVVQHLILIEMDLEWLLPQQIEQILRLCDLSSIHDPSLAANILEQHNWNFEFALNDLVGQNDQIDNTHQQRQAPPVVLPQRPQEQQNLEEYNDHLQHEDDFELGEHDYHQLDLPAPSLLAPAPPAPQQHRSILAQQNREYEEMQKNYIAKLAEDEEWDQYLQLKEKEFEQHREELAGHVVKRPIQIKFRLAGRSETFAFDLSDPVGKVFKYVSGHLRDALEHKYAEIDLTQAFPAISLRDKLTATLEEVFGESNGEVLIVREL